MLVLLGVVVVILGFVTRRNPALVVGVTGIVTGLLGRMDPLEVLAAFGQSFADSRSVTVFAVVLPVIGLLERYGLREQARRLIGRLSGLSAGRFLAVYLLVRQVTAAFGLNNIGGPAQTVRPLVAPMAEAAAERRLGATLPDRLREKVRSYASSSDTVGLFFGEDCFIAIGSILLITGFVNSTYGQDIEPTQLALWAAPLAVCAFVIHGARLLLLDRQLEREMALASAEHDLPLPKGADK
ncbi:MULTISPECIES: DUF969 domain-containing protein [Streptomyces]|jgi:uncharacterized membrane protein|uniref:DUF969 domain-containing protein n=1 Tax=Streptomyces griseoaurantiacus TaxID=68213 RepID=A0A7W2HSM6_9ACTN|nr:MULTISPECIES: DUF969 domain-containing protein [Streptomyces]WTI30002.1 DUF969 domain-containing protein [Streptomyces jietaisiensis]MBA5220194.1 DUF969 domain-containing protein [Streptomyces griseoaurantiacus]MDX3090244.1 DUF969 domain-containing protein [Streptomyces sp. ME12-02E]MDX3332374.1 DUF969 domain-containing protein [Streptomyces sp. ME02-6978a]MDX3358922.1 DUF969 domain-containing protein [Streptomyces sp. ME02-6978.2a]